MIEYYLKLFSLAPGATMDEVKDAYRGLVKKHHPDLYPDEGMKRIQEVRMVQINDAYERLKEELGHEPQKEKTPSVQPKTALLEKPVKDMAFKIYRDGIEFFNKAVIRRPRKMGVTISKKGPRFWAMEHIERQEILDSYKDALHNLRFAETDFSRLLSEYPQSEWAFDSEEKLGKIEKLYQIYQAIIENAVRDYKGSKYARLSDFDHPVA